MVARTVVGVLVVVVAGTVVVVASVVVVTSMVVVGSSDGMLGNNEADSMSLKVDDESGSFARSVSVPTESTPIANAKAVRVLICVLEFLNMVSRHDITWSSPGATAPGLPSSTCVFGSLGFLRPTPLVLSLTLVPPAGQRAHE